MERVPMKNIAAKSLLGEGVSHAGFVVKPGGRLRSMQTRYLILREGCLYYYKDFKSSKEQNAFCIIGYEVKADLSEDGVYGISLKPESFGKKPFYFLVSSNDERQTWIEKLTQEMGRVAADGCESYDYCRDSTAPIEVQHDYEKTDNIETFHPPKPASNAGQPWMPRPKDTPPRQPEAPPPITPKRSGMLPARPVNLGIDRKPNPFMPKSLAPKPPAPKPQAPKPQERTMPPYPNPNSKPVLPVAPKPAQYPRPPVPKKNSDLSWHSMSEDIYLTRKAAADALAQKLKQKDPKAPPGYEIQRLKTEGIDSDSSDSDDPNGNQISGTMLQRGKPSGCSSKKKPVDPLGVSPDDPDEKVLPPSVFQDSFSRETSECLLRSIGKQGMYLIREGRTGLKVITVFLADACKHYQVFSKNGVLFLKEGEPSFKTLPDLVRHYLKSNLPTCHHTLELPYS
ncbi:swi5-dependent recombination DNA repair protein 1 homolog [Rhopilema esculentum]|uniref:swi5-dependent recombination DNA repair protein 1 homolog n=1 Tax=Rhopilema esculentum TaxID=499914 RepID=UPI0031DB209B